MKRIFYCRVAGLLLCLAVGGCKVGPNYSTPASKVAPQWTQSSAVITNQPLSQAEAHWWRQFDDPVLNQLVEDAHRQNLSLQEAGVRILEARARLNKSIGSLFPQQQGISGDLNYSRLNDGLVSALPGVKPDYVSDQILFAASWEIDFWGKYRRGIESDRATFLATVNAYEDALITVTADVASTYVNIRTIEERLLVARQNVELQKESLRIATAQFNAGETSERDVLQARTQLAQTESQIPILEQTLTQTRNGLAVLLGESCDGIGKHLGSSRGIPAVPAIVATGIPHDLLRRRPDIRAAGLAAASKSALIGVARASMYPSFSLSGEFGFSSNNEGNSSLDDIFSWHRRVTKAGAGFFFPIFNYGRLLNQVRVTDAQFQEAIISYQNTVLSAQAEVENGLAAYINQQRASVSLATAATAARKSAQLALVQYKGGQTDYTTVLTAEQAQLAVEDAFVNTRGNVVLGLISVYRALGGVWELPNGGDVVSKEIKAEMARRTDWGKFLEPANHLPRKHADKAVTTGKSDLN